MNLVELPWLIISLFERGRFAGQGGSPEERSGRRNIMRALILLLLLLVSLRVIDVLRRIDAHPVASRGAERFVSRPSDTGRRKSAFHTPEHIALYRRP